MASNAKIKLASLSLSSPLFCLPLCFLLFHPCNLFLTAVICCGSPSCLTPVSYAIFILHPSPPYCNTPPLLLSFLIPSCLPSHFFLSSPSSLLSFLNTSSIPFFLLSPPITGMYRNWQNCKKRDHSKWNSWCVLWVESEYGAMWKALIKNEMRIGERLNGKESQRLMLKKLLALSNYRRQGILVPFID